MERVYRFIAILIQEESLLIKKSRWLNVILMLLA